MKAWKVCYFGSKNYKYKNPYGVLPEAQASQNFSQLLTYHLFF